MLAHRHGEGRRIGRVRSDCSGFVSWSWGLAAPGETTRTLAPYETTVSALITVEELEPGDALNGTGHVMLFGGWADEAAGKAIILQESRCGTTAQEKVAIFKGVDTTTLQMLRQPQIQADPLQEREKASGEGVNMRT